MGIKIEVNNKLTKPGCVIFFILLFSISCVERKDEKEIQENQPILKEEKDVEAKNDKEREAKEPKKQKHKRKEELAKADYRGGVYHIVEPGQTLWRICKTYNVDMEEVIKINHLNDPTEIYPGQKIFIPGAKEVKKVKPFEPHSSGGEEANNGNIENEQLFPSDKPARKLAWPVQGGKLCSGFGARESGFHEGIDICSPVGSPIYAADDGRVTYSADTIRGYGNMIIIKHSGNISTIYAHNHKNLVKSGDFVRRGDKIAEVGQTGRATAPHLHFEVRAGKNPVDPLPYLER